MAGDVLVASPQQRGIVAAMFVLLGWGLVRVAALTPQLGAHEVVLYSLAVALGVEFADFGTGVYHFSVALVSRAPPGVRWTTMAAPRRPSWGLKLRPSKVRSSVSVAILNGRASREALDHHASRLLLRAQLLLEALGP